MSRHRRHAWLGAAFLLAGCSKSNDAKPGHGADASVNDARVRAADAATFEASGPYAVGTRAFSFIDTSRPTPANGTYAGAPDRTLLTRVWYPAADGDGGAVASGGPFPIVAYAHGFLGNAGSEEPLKRHLASHGYIVVAPAFPLSTGGAPGGPSLFDVAHQPADLAFVMAQVSHLTGVDSDLATAVDASKQAVAGLSLGGSTVLLSVYHPTLHLPNIRAAVAFAPASCFFTKALYVHPLPTVIVSGTADELVEFDPAILGVLDAAPPPLTLVRLVGANHVGFTGLELPNTDNSDSIGCTSVANAVAVSGIPGPSSPIATELAQGASGPVLDVNGCGGGDSGNIVCLHSYKQTMKAARQEELARVIALAHLEAILQNRTDAARFLAETLQLTNSDLEVTVKR